MIHRMKNHMKVKNRARELFNDKIQWQFSELIEINHTLKEYNLGFDIKPRISFFNYKVREELFRVLFNHQLYAFLIHRLNEIINPNSKNSETQRQINDPLFRSLLNVAKHNLQEKRKSIAAFKETLSNKRLKTDESMSDSNPKIMLPITSGLKKNNIEPKDNLPLIIETKLRNSVRELGVKKGSIPSKNSSTTKSSAIGSSSQRLNTTLQLNPTNPAKMFLRKQNSTILPNKISPKDYKSFLQNNRDYSLIGLIDFKRSFEIVKLSPFYDVVLQTEKFKAKNIYDNIQRQARFLTKLRQLQKGNVKSSKADIDKIEESLHSQVVMLEDIIDANIKHKKNNYVAPEDPSKFNFTFDDELARCMVLSYFELQRRNPKLIICI